MDETLDFALQGVACDDQDANTFLSLGRVRLARCEYELAIDAIEVALRCSEFKRVALRSEKTDRCCKAIVNLAATVIQTRRISTGTRDAAALLSAALVSLRIRHRRL